MDISILIISFNTRDFTLECLRSVFRETEGCRFEVIVVDNDSRDGSADAIEAEFRDSVRLIRSGENLGFAQANNIAAEHATGRMILLLNPDTVVQNGAIDRLQAFADSNPDAGIWGGRTILADGSLNPTSCWRRISLWTLFCSLSGLTCVFPKSELLNPECFGRWQRDSIRQVDIVTGCFLLITAEFWQKLGGFDSLFFMYGEEADLCLRARRLGARPMITPDAQIIHYGSASDPVHAEKAVAVLRGRATLIRRHFPGWQRGLGLFLIALIPATKCVAYMLSAKLNRNPARVKTAEFWRTVWRQRRVWLPGYTI